ncbi:MAG: ribonucleotide reductase N-terminal alpha domain-containing protein [Patescibacteria group bacterium]|nr:hypothetical protein [Patescibacteria group bacterium]
MKDFKTIKKIKTINIEGNALDIFMRRYALKGKDGKPSESLEKAFFRVASFIADAEKTETDKKKYTDLFYALMGSKRFIPNTPTWSGANTKLGQLAACFVLPISDDMGKESDGIFQTLRDAALIQQSGGGNGFSFSRLRPKGARISASNGIASGPLSFMEIYDAAFGEIAQGGTRRGANMAVLRVDHPDILDFIKCKAEEGKISNFNISVGITDKFMRAVKNNKDFDLINPTGKSVWKTLKARDVFNEIAKFAYKNGEPGILFLDTANKYNPVPNQYTLEATNPCVTGETLVATPKGWKRVEDISKGDEICTVMSRGVVDNIEVHKNTPVFKVYLSDGGVIRVTATHQFHIRGSREKFFRACRLDQTKVGSWVRVFKGAIPNNPIPKERYGISNKEYGFLVGLLVGDGCYTPHGLSKNIVRISTHSDELEWNKCVEEYLRKVGAKKVYTYTNKNSKSMMMDPKPGKVVSDWVKSLPLTPAKSPDKFLPEVYINSNKEFLLGLIDGLFSTDGSVDLSSNHPIVRFHTSSEKLARQVRLILLMFGVHGRISESPANSFHYIGGRKVIRKHPKFDVTVSGQSFGRFFEQFTLSHPEKQKRMVKAALSCNFTGGNWAARIVKIEPDGNDKVYDVHESFTDTWITEGYVSRGCGEQWLGGYENCCLGHINLSASVTGKGIDWEHLRESIMLATRFLDNVVTQNKYVPAVPQLKEAALKNRRIGLGFMGLGDVFYKMGIRYGDKKSLDLASQITEFMRFYSIKESIELAKERGAFPGIKGSVYNPKNFKWEIPAPLFKHKNNFGRPKIDWEEIKTSLKKYGIRNSTQLTVAPTGTTSTVFDIEGYGCEPVFALAYFRNVYQAAGGDENLRLTYVSPLFKGSLDKSSLTKNQKEKIIEEALNKGTIQHCEEAPKNIKGTFVVSTDITAKEHILMQAVIQKFVDNSISKTCNFPENATEEDIKNLYIKGWELGCKGLTVYVTGSRKEVVLETKETAEKKQEALLKLGDADIRPRPSVVVGRTHKITTPVGKAFITVNRNGETGKRPFEVFINIGKSGSDLSSMAEAMGRLISGWLRSAKEPNNALEEIQNQLSGIGGSMSIGFGQNRISSLPDAVAKVLNKELMLSEKFEKDASQKFMEKTLEENIGVEVTVQPSLFIKDASICPECNNMTLVETEGCVKCYSCSYTRC